MTIDIFFTYFIAVVLLTASPGPMVLLAMKHGVEHGVSGALLSSLTGMICICLMIVLCFFGISQVLQSHSILRNILIASGVIYIFYLGLVAVLTSNCKDDYSVSKNTTESGSKLKIIREMGVIAWTNPKDWIFFGLFLPQFINEESALLPQLAIILITFAVCEFFFLSLFGSCSYFFASVFKQYMPVYKKFLGVVLMLIAALMGLQAFNSVFI